MDIHKSDIRLEKAIKRFKEDKLISTRNKKLIIDFLDFLYAENLSHSRIIKYLYILKQVSKIFNKDFDKISKKDVILFYKNINTNEKFEEWTKSDYKVLTRRFYQWIKKEIDIKDKETKCAVREICSKEIKRAKSRQKLPEHLLTPEEVMQIADNTMNSRDKSFVLTLYESACRIGEIIPIKIKDIQFDQYGAIINITGKTGPRPVRLCASPPSISNWLTNHPDRDNNEAFLFCGIGRTNYKKMLSYEAARKIVFEAAAIAGIKKRVNLHKFRASRATQLIREGMPEPTLCKYAGWEINSNEIKTYVKLSQKDVEDEILRINGLIKEEDTRGGFKLIICPRCGVKNYPGSRFCSACSLILDEISIEKFEKEKELATRFGLESMEMLKDPTFRDFFNEMLLNTVEKYKKIKDK